MRDQLAKVFFGIPVSTNRAVVLKSLVLTQYPGLVGQLRWTKPGNYHLTLHFLGQIKRSRISQLISLLEPLTALYDPFELIIGKIVQFPHVNASLIAAMLQEEALDIARLFQLHEAVAERLKHWDFPIDSRLYQPHITLCRSKQRFVISPIPLTEREKPMIIPVKQFVLYESVSKEGGQAYMPLHQFVFGLRNPSN